MKININSNKRKIDINDHVMVHAYKYKRWLYRTWEYPQVIYMSDEYLIINLKNSRVLTSEENSVRCFSSKISKTSFWYFFPNKWYNFIVSIDESGRLSGYINISSPFIYEEGTIKYYDFDLDFRINFDYSWIEVDIKEFEKNIIKFNYPPELIKIIKDVEKDIINKLDQNFFQQLMNKENLLKFIKTKEEKYEPWKK